MTKFILPLAGVLLIVAIVTAIGFRGEQLGASMRNAAYSIDGVRR